MVSEGLKIRRERKITLYEALAALRAQLEKVGPEKAPQTWNLGQAIVAIGEAVQTLQHDVTLLHNKLQPVLRDLQDDQIEVTDHLSERKDR